MTMPTRLSTTIVSIADVDRQTALSFAQQQPTREKATQVYRNTLAVLATKHCLDLLEIPTDLHTSDGWNPFSRLASDVADLPITGLGRLECRPVNAEAQHCDVPPEVLENRLAYLVVQLDTCCHEATMLGFALSAIDGSLAVKHLHPLEELLLHLELLSAAPRKAPQTVTPCVQLSQWLHQIVAGTAAQQSTYGRTWQTVDALLGRLHEPTFVFRTKDAFPSLRDIALPEQLQQIVEQLYASQRYGQARSGVVPLLPDSGFKDSDFKAALVQLIQTTSDEEVRWKAAEILWTIDPGNPASGMRRVLDLGLLLARQSLVLMVAILQPSLDATPTSDNHFSVMARVYPLGEEGHLPIGLQLAVMDRDGNLGLGTQARARDNYIQIKLNGALGEHFSIRLRLEDEVLTEYFVI